MGLSYHLDQLKGSMPLGRFGHYAGVPLVMLWNQPPGWGPMLAAVVGTLGVPDRGVVTVGCRVLGPVADFRASPATGTARDEENRV